MTVEDRRILRLALTLVLGGLAALLAGLAAVAVILLAAGPGSAGGLGAAGVVDEAVVRPELLGSSLTAVMLVLVMVATINGAAALAFTAVAAGLRRRPLARYLTSAPRFRWRLLAAGLVLFTIILGPLLLIETWLEPEHTAAPILTVAGSLAGRLVYGLGGVGLLLIAAGAEELVFRGWLLKVGGAFTRRVWILLPLSGALFSAVHFDPNLDAFLVRAAMGIGLAWMTLRLGGIEFAIGAHAANNILLLLFVAPMSLAPAPPHPFEMEALIAAAVALAGHIALAEITARWGALRRWTGVVVAPTGLETR